MGIQPIDLQTLYLQMDKVGKQQGAEQKAKADAVIEQGEKARTEQMKKENSVQELKEYNKIDVNKDGHNGTNENPKNAKNPESKKEDSQQDDFFTDPTIGRKIDFSG